jgi:hypothetical protein
MKPHEQKNREKTRVKKKGRKQRAIKIKSKKEKR